MSPPTNSIELRTSNFLPDLSAKVLATGLTFLEGDNFQRLKPSDFISYLTQGGSDNIKLCSETAQKIKALVVESIFLHNGVSERARAMELFINTGMVSMMNIPVRILSNLKFQECQRQRNFSSAVAIALSLHSPPVESLMETKKALARAVRERLSSLRDMVHPRGYLAAFRTAGNAEFGLPWLPYHMPKLKEVLRKYPVMIEKDVINFRRYIEFMDRLQEEIPCDKVPTLRGQPSQVVSRVRKILETVPLFDENDGKTTARIAEVIALETRIRRHHAHALNMLGFI